MVNQFAKPNPRTVEIGRQQQQTIDVNSNRYRILFAHVHPNKKLLTTKICPIFVIVALACAMVGVCFHIIMTYEDFKKGTFYRMIRHIPCAFLFALVVVGNRLMKPLFYYFYLVLNFFFVGFVIVAEILREYELRTNPEFEGQARTPIAFFIAVWVIVVIVELIVYFVICRDLKFVKEVKGTPSQNQKIIPFLFQDRTIPVISRY